MASLDTSAPGGDDSRPRVFVVRGGDEERVVAYALAENVVATGWSALGDLDTIGDDVEGAMRHAYDDVEPETLRAWATAVRIFREIRRGDQVILPITSKGQFAVGTVVGGYQHRPQNEDQAANCYPVEWLATNLPRSLLGDLRTRVDRQPAVHRIAVDDAAALIDRMLERREPIALTTDSGAAAVRNVFAAALDAIADKRYPDVDELIKQQGIFAVKGLLAEPRPMNSGTGQATPAEVPWISVYPESAAASAQQGIYAVYLFAADGSAVYLSFNQGTENVVGGLSPLRKRALDMRRAAGLNDAGDALDLRASAARPKKYEAGNAYAIRYGRDALPHDDVLRVDLATVLGYVEAARRRGLEFDPSREATHLLLKWSADINASRLDDHRAIVAAQGSTWWAKLGTTPIAATKLAMFEKQINDGVPTHVYLYGNKSLVRARLEEITDDRDRVDRSLMPDSLHPAEAALFARISSFEDLEPGWALANLVLASDPDPEKVAGALSNQTTALFVFERFSVAGDEPEHELTLSWLSQQTLWTENDLGELLEALDPATGKGQIILAGPPGTGKTWVAERVARYLTQDVPLNRRTVQFHPSYGYEEFVEGIRPTATEHGIAFEPVKGTVLRMAEGVDGSDDIHVLVIDEINRANIPRVFGELLYLLEYRDQDMELQYSANFQLPSNLRFIATMNTADRSVRSIDVALRRRFEVFECPADADVLERFYDLPGHTTSVPDLVDGFRALNKELTARLDRHHTIGQSFFMAPTYDRPRLERAWRRQILPLIEDYFFDQPDVVDQFTLDKFWAPAN